MGKPSQGTTNLLYKKSNSTFNTRSKTCSGTSQFLTKSGILQFKNKISKTNYYLVNGKLKRDLSIETDKCKLRGYYKKKFGRYKCTVNTPDSRTVDESKFDHHSCGDSVHKEHDQKTHLNIDVASLVVENLKDLLNNWIKKYLLTNDETKQKVETVLDSILHKLELQRKSSSCTYTLDIKVNERKLSSNKSKCTKKSRSGKQSCQTVPVPGKHIKLISTLSIPRNMKRYIASRNSQYQNRACRKIRYKNVFLTVSRSSTFLLNSSSFNLLSISTKSFTKRCANYNNKEIKSNKKYQVVLLPKSSYSESMSESFYQEKVKMNLKSQLFPYALEIEPAQSLVRSIYAEDPANISSIDRNIYKCKNDNYTMTDTDCTNKDIKSSQCRQLNWEKAKDVTDADVAKIRNTHRKKIKPKTLSQRRRIQKTKRKYLHSLKTPSKKNMNATNHYEKSSSVKKDGYLLKKLQNIFKHFASYTDSKNIKFDVRINVFSGSCNNIADEINNDKNEKSTSNGNKLTSACNIVSPEILSKNKISNLIKENQNISANLSQTSQQKLISILDGATSQSKYVISKAESYKITENSVKPENVTIKPTNHLAGEEIAKDISELRIIIRDLAITTEKFVKEHLNNKKPSETEVIVRKKSIKIGNEINKDNFKLSTLSKAVQYSNDETPITSGLKLKKDPKKRESQEFDTRLTKKSISYNIIENESILKVTDMTSAQAETSTDILINKATNCSIPKSESQYQITVGQSNRKLLAYYCDEFIKSRQCIHNRNTSCTCLSNTGKYIRCIHEDNDCSPLIINESECLDDIVNTCKNPERRLPLINVVCATSNPVHSCSSAYVDIEDRKKLAVRSRSGINFSEGLLYCVLLWIPVFVIFWLIYEYVIRDIILPTYPDIGRTSQPSRNNTLFRLTLSDLGF